MPGSKPGRDSMDREIFGMSGVPEGAEPGKPFGDQGGPLGGGEGCH